MAAAPPPPFTSSSSPSLILVFFFFLLCHLAHSSCPLLSSSPRCDQNSSNLGKEGKCGEHRFRCNGSGWEMKVDWLNPWFPVINETFGGENNITIVTRDSQLAPSIPLQRCEFLYVFSEPRPRLEPLLHLESLPYDLSSSPNCSDIASYNFSSPSVVGSFRSTPCGGDDLYYSQKAEGPPNNSSPDPSPSIWWELQLWNDGGNNGSIVFSVVSIGFSRSSRKQRLPQREEFNCHMTGGNCSSVVPGAANSTCGCNKTCPRLGPPPRSAKKKVIITTVATAVGFFLMCLFLYLCRNKFKGSILFRKSKLKYVQTVETFLEKHGKLTPKRYTYSDVKKMTKSFGNKLGQGGFGMVFKGKLPDGRWVAVKVLNDSNKRNGEEFVNEVASIGRTYHVNIVSLLGFSSEGSKQALIYEYMPNGSLEKFIFSEKPRATPPLGWEKLYEIAVGIATGLEYLHRGCETRIVHFDIKPHNILLDEDFCPKISDFGMAKLCRPKGSILSTIGTRGTVGYIAPEVFSRNFGVISSKSDIYSYGMMVLEMVGGRRNVEAGLDNTSEIYFPHWIYEHLDRGDDLEDFWGVITDETKEVARKMILVGLWCIQTDPRSRPSISKVVEMLEGNSKDLQMPPKPYLSSPLISPLSSTTVSDNSI